MVIRLRAGRWSNRCCILKKASECSSKCHDQAWGPFVLLVRGYRGSFSRIKTIRVWRWTQTHAHIRLMPWVWIFGFTPPIPIFFHVQERPYVWLSCVLLLEGSYRGAGKSLARPGRKQARKNARRRARFQQNRDASCHQVSFLTRQGAEWNSRHSDRNISLFPSWSG